MDRQLHRLSDSQQERTALAVDAAEAGAGMTLMWQWLPPDLRKAMKRSNATASLPCSELAPCLSSFTLLF